MCYPEKFRKALSVKGIDNFISLRSDTNINCGISPDDTQKNVSQTMTTFSTDVRIFLEVFRRFSLFESGYDIEMESDRYRGPKFIFRRSHFSSYIDWIKISRVVSGTTNKTHTPDKVAE